MTIDLQGVIAQSTPLLGPDRAAAPGPQEKKPLHLGDNGRLELREPRGTPPGRWTRFKAALINVPLLGRLQTIQVAGDEVRIARLQAEFRDDFHHALADRYGRDVADRAFAGKSAGSARKPLTARRIEKIMRKVRNEGEASEAGNSRAVEGAIRGLPAGRGRGAAADCVRLWASATPGYFERPLQENEVQAACQGAGPVLEELERHGVNPGVLRAALDAFANDLLSTPDPEQRTALAVRYVGAVTRACHEACNRATIEHSFPEELASSSSSPRGPYIRPDDLPLVALLCAHALGPNTPLLPDEAAAQAWHDLADVRGTLRRELPQASGERIDAVLTKVSKGFPALTKETLLASARKEFLLSEMEREFSFHDKQSMFWNAVLEAGAAHQMAKRQTGSPFDANLTALLTALAKDVLNDLDYRAQHIQGDPSLSAVLPQTRQQLIDHVKQATKEHLEALDKIQSSTTLNAGQKQILRNYVSPFADTDASESVRPQRLDTVQLRQYEAIADTIADRLPRMQQAIQNGEPAVLHDCTAEIVSAFRDGYGKILTHAETMWLSRSFDGTDSEQRVFELCVNLALAKHFAPGRSPRPATRGRSAPASRSGSPQVPSRSGSVQRGDRSESPTPTTRRPSSLRTSTSELGTPSAGTSAAIRPQDHDARELTAEQSGAPGEEGYVGFAGAERQFRHACAQSPSMMIAKLAMFHGDIVRISTGEEFSIDQEEREPLHRMNPELLVRVLADPSCAMDGGGSLDHRGVFADGKFDHLVARNYDPAAVFVPERHSVPLTGQDLSSESVPDKLKGVLAGADIIVNGRRLTLDPNVPEGENPADGAIQTFGRTFGAEVGLDAVITAVVASDALQDFSSDIRAAAFDPPVNMAHQRGVHEIWQDRDGSWLVRSTQVSHPLSQGGQPLGTDGVVLCTMTHRITRAAAADGSGPSFQVQLLGTRPTAVIMLTEPKRAPAD